MGTFAEIARERDYNTVNDEPEYVVNMSYGKISNTKLQEILSSEDGFLIRNYKYNILCKCIWQGTKAILCEIQDFGNRSDVGRSFYCPISIIRYNPKEKLVLHIPNWAKLTYKVCLNVK